MTKERNPHADDVAAIIQRLRADLGGNSLPERISMEVLRLRGEGREQLAEALASEGAAL